MSKPGTPRPHGYGHVDPSAPWPIRALMAVYRFLASVKLAVLSIAGLAGSLAYATWFEKRYGSDAVRVCVYEGPWFSILLAFLATNILCAALIRFPWKRRQTGFVVTHAGLLVLIFGSWWGFQYSKEGQAGAVEGKTVSQLVVTRAPVVRIKEHDTRSGADGYEYELPFYGSPFDWPEGKYQVISKAKDPFKVAVKGYFASARPAPIAHVPTENGTPMLEVRPRMKPPGAPALMDVFASPDQRWLVIPHESVGRRTVRKAGPAKFAFVYADRPEMIEDFLNPPKDPGTQGVARVRYTDRSGKPRTHEIRLDEVAPGATVALPDSDFTVGSIEAERREPDRAAIVRMLGDTELYLVKMGVRKAGGPEILHMAFSGMPMFPASLSQEGHGASGGPLVSLHYYRPPLLGGGGMAGNFGVVEVMGDPSGKLYYRVFGRAEASGDPAQANTPRPGVLRKGPAPLKLGERIVAFGGNPNMPMTLDFAAEAYLPSGEEYEVYERQPMPDGKQGDGLAAAQVEITAGGETKSVWVQKPPGLDPPPYTPIRVGGKDYEVAFDSVREPLGFSMALKDFEVTFDPGTKTPASYTSEVLLTDEKAGIKDRPVTITMNHPLTHNKLTFYQSSYHPTESGDFASIFQVGHDAGRPLKYLGSLLIVLGAFLQFYMKAGLFSTTSKDGVQKAADRARKILKKKEGKIPAAAARNGKAKKTKSYDDAIL
jgi:hypothetical protein